MASPSGRRASAAFGGRAAVLYPQLVFRLLWILGIVLVVLAAGAVVWVGLDLPPVKLVAKYGFPPAGGPASREVEMETGGGQNP